MIKIARAVACVNTYLMYATDEQEGVISTGVLQYQEKNKPDGRAKLFRSARIGEACASPF